METKISGLPPNKRFNFIHQDLNFPKPSCLPAKKRKNPTSIPSGIESDSTSVTTYCLPAKKRICALNPNLFSSEPFSPPIDLNLEYDPRSDQFQDQQTEEKKKPKQENKNKNDEEEEEDGIVCAICQSTDGDPTDPIVFCDGCDLMVHATCYGSPLTHAIPDGDWFCTFCQNSKNPQNPKNQTLSCCLCGIQGGAIKPTNDGRWAHIVCALYVPEVFFNDPEGRKGIDCSMVPRRRWGKTCYVCETRKGCVVDCSEEKCGLSFHVTCGLNQDLCIVYKQGRNKGAIVAGFCKSHTDLWIKQQATGKFKIVARNEEK